MVSVFLSLCVFAVVLMGCGIPQWFYVYDSTSDYIWATSNSGFSDNGYVVGLDFTPDAESSLEKVQSGDSPALMFFYILDDEPVINYNENIRTNFKRKYKLNGAGIGLEYASDGSVLTYTTGSEANGDKVDHKLYPFTLNGTRVTPPKYIINPSSGTPQSKESLEGTMRLEDHVSGEPTRKLFIYNGTILNDASEIGRLGRFNGGDFYYAYSNIPSDEREFDYNLIHSDSNGVYLHIFVAFNVSPSSPLDRFNNIFWSELKYVGWIQLTPTSTT